jgi:pimeloyl-ACP methyl ester carboxylesterase
MIHGGAAGSVASFDLDVTGYSLAEDVARAGHAVYLMDVRGFGNSTKPADLNNALTEKENVTATEAVRDIEAVVNEIRRRERTKKVAVFGWASGGHWMGLYVTRHNKKISHLVMLNSIYGVDAPWVLREAFEDKEQPGIYNRKAEAYRLADATGLLGSWNNAIPSEDKSEWREPRVAQAYVQAALACDVTANTRQPPSLRIPGAYRREAFEMSLGKKLYEAKNIRVPTLVLRGELDHWSRPQDLTALDSELRNAPRKQIVEIPAATHFVLLDKPERGRARFVQELLSFLAK